jgi:predicted N-acetyltransferase YhbS
MPHELDDAPGAWHQGAVGVTSGRVIAISSFYPVACPLRPEARPAVQLQFMAVDPALQRQGLGSAVIAEAIRRLKASDAVPVGQRSRQRGALYERFGFHTIEGSASVPASRDRPHHLIRRRLVAALAGLPPGLGNHAR